MCKLHHSPFSTLSAAGSSSGSWRGRRASFTVALALMSAFAGCLYCWQHPWRKIRHRLNLADAGPHSKLSVPRGRVFKKQLRKPSTRPQFRCLLWWHCGYSSEQTIVTLWAQIPVLSENHHWAVKQSWQLLRIRSCLRCKSPWERVWNPHQVNHQKNQSQIG